MTGDDLKWLREDMQATARATQRLAEQLAAAAAQTDLILAKTKMSIAVLRYLKHRPDMRAKILLPVRQLRLQREDEQV